MTKAETNNKIYENFEIKYETSHIIYETNISLLLYNFFSFDISLSFAYYDNVISFFHFLFIIFFLLLI